MGGGPVFLGVTRSAPVPISDKAAEHPPADRMEEDEYVFPPFCPQTPPRLRPPPEIPLLVEVLDSLSRTGSTTCRISLFSRGAFERLGSCWEVPLIRPGTHPFSIQTTFTSFHLTCTLLKEGEVIAGGDIGPTFVTETVSENDKGFRVFLGRDRDSTLLRSSIEQCSASEILPSWKGSIRRALFHSVDGEAASPADE